MEQIFKKFLHTGVGLMSSASEHLQKTVNDLTEQNKVAAEEGKRVVDDFVSDVEAQKEKLEAKLKAISDKVLANFDFTSKSEVKDLHKRLQDLEEQLKEK